jgi:gliding motility-associated lipoprotein GldH
MKKLIVFSLLSLMILSSCDSSKIYEKHIDIDRITWNRFDIKTYNIDIKDISAKYDFYVAIRYISEIPYKYITIKFILYTPSGETRIMDQKIMLKDKAGNLLGDGMGDLYDLNSLVRKDFQFTEPGICKVEVSSTMSQIELPGIMQVGLIVKKAR